jgi:hypothetical protein
MSNDTSPEEDGLNFDFPNLNDSFLDLFAGDVPLILSSLSERLKEQVDQVTKTTDALNEKWRAKRDEFIKEQMAILRKTMKQKSVIMFRDKITFVFGVLFVIMTAFVVGGYPHLMPLYYVGVVLPMVTYRYYYYRSLKWHYFLA